MLLTKPMAERFIAGLDLSEPHERILRTKLNDTFGFYGRPVITVAELGRHVLNDQMRLVAADHAWTNDAQDSDRLLLEQYADLSAPSAP